MRVIEREMKVIEERRSGAMRSQASFNSDGVLTLRNYDDKDKDEIIIFSHVETNAILELFRMMKNKNCDLPF